MTTQERDVAGVRAATVRDRPAGYTSPDLPNRRTDPVSTATGWRAGVPAPPRREYGPPPIGEEDDDPPPAGPAVWTEIARTTSTVRVENPEDPEQYVDVERVETLLMRGPGGEQVEWRLSHG
ncbi:MAG: hypothetical protein VR70_05780 [Rhodospirillaceae bacterium BRH_c57]|nr:MAG: hypothetical protein VR70_05780 [Rhodospirillaceae bacterium BRH_c57]